MLALRLQRLPIVERNDFPFRLDGGWNSIFPFYFVRIQNELVLGSVIKHRHLLGADDHEPLLLKRVQPADENMGLNSAWKTELTGCDVEHIAGQICAATAGDVVWRFVQKR